MMSFRLREKTEKILNLDFHCLGRRFLGFFYDNFFWMKNLIESSWFVCVRLLIILIIRHKVFVLLDCFFFLKILKVFKLMSWQIN